MGKLDWSRVSFRVMDPARYQRSEESSLTPDDTRSKAKKHARTAKRLKQPTPASLDRQAENEARMAQDREARRKRIAESQAVQSERQRLKQLVKEKRREEARVQQIEAKRRKKEKQAADKAAAEARRAAFRIYQTTPEYAASMAKKRAEMEAKKKTHFEAWVDQLVELKGDRERLRHQWKERLRRRGSS